MGGLGDLGRFRKVDQTRAGALDAVKRRECEVGTRRHSERLHSACRGAEQVPNTAGALDASTQEWERDGPSSGARVMLLTMRPGSKISAGALAALAPAPVTSDNLGIRMVCPRCVFRYDDQPHFYQWNKLSINNVTFRP